ncbi:MAG TPA: integrin alpha, partial [Kofleriaceae bacterium]
MRCAALLVTLVTANAGCSQCLGLSEVSLGEPARLIAPLSMSTVTQQRPLLRWQLSTVQHELIVDLCKDRSCMSPLPVTAQVSGDHVSAVPSAPLPAGWVFWRVRTGSGAHMVSSATWQFWVGKSSASNPVDTSNGAILDVNGDGYPDLLIGADSAGAGAGTAHLYLGSATASVTEWNAASTATRIDLISPDSANASFGYSVSSAGDINGDGFADFLIGAPGAGANSGTAHLYFGSAKPSADDWNGTSARRRIDLDDLAGEGSVFGASVASAGDVNGDGFADFLVGAAKAGMAHLYLGSATPGAEDWSGT